MKNLVIELTRPSGLTLPPAKSEKPNEAKGLSLLPGENTVTEAYWGAVKKNPAVIIWLRTSILRRVREGEAAPIDVNWSKIKIDDAGAILEQIDNVETIQKIKELTPKKGIKELCAFRIDQLFEDAEKENG